MENRLKTSSSLCNCHKYYDLLSSSPLLHPVEESPIKRGQRRNPNSLILKLIWQWSLPETLATHRHIRKPKKTPGSRSLVCNYGPVAKIKFLDFSGAVAQRNALVGILRRCQVRRARVVSMNHGKNKLKWGSDGFEVIRNRLRGEQLKLER